MSPSSHHRLLLLALPLAGALFAAPGLAATTSLVRDINSTPDDYDAGGAVSELAAVGGKVVFTALEPSTGLELWVSDGTTEGTALLRDLEPGSDSGSPSVLASSGRLTYFLADGPDFGSERLWRTDGTRHGTLPLTPFMDFDPREPGAVDLAAGGDRLFFAACSEQHGCELWRTDGTVAGTALVKDIYPDGRSSEPRKLTLVGATLLFLAESERGLGLWRSDGTAAGTRLVHDLPNFDDGRHLTAVGSRLLFLAKQEGDELWVSDGTPAGTRPITAFAAPEPFWATRFVNVMNGLAYFIADDVVGGSDLWRSDGTPAGTRRVTDFPYAHPFPFPFAEGTTLETVGGALLFAATDGLSPVKLWTSDGTPATTVPLAGCREPCPRVSDQTHFVRVGRRVLFSALGAAQGALWSTDGTGAGTVPLGARLCTECSAPKEAGGLAYFIGADATSYGIWRTDGTPAGTRRLATVGAPGGSSFEVFEVVAAGAKVLFTARDSQRRPQLWATQGTPAGTGVLTAFAEAPPSSFPRQIAPLAGGVLFTACSGEDRAVWKSDGSATGTTPLAVPTESCTPFDSVKAATSINGLLFFLRDGQLWRTDGTDAGTLQLTSSNTHYAFALVPFQGKALFAAHEQGPHSFWASDGTPAGTQKLVDLPAHLSGYGIEYLTSVGPELYFVAHEQVWRSDGTSAGTRQLTSFQYGSFNYPPYFTRLGGAVFFGARHGVFGYPLLYRTDGTAAGTALVLPASPPSVWGVTDLTTFGDALYFFASAPPGNGHPRALYRSDGTSHGTVVLARVSPFFDSFRSDLSYSAILNGVLFFAADDGVHGTELWKTDGTAGGTVLVSDMAPGPQSSQPLDLVVAGGRIFFTAHDSEHGRELWESDGTEDGTRMVQDLAPGALSSEPDELTAAAGQLLFAADDGVWGKELWSYPLAAAPPCQPSPAVLCLGSGRYKAEAHWRDFAGNSGAGRAVALTADTGYFWFFDAANVEVILKVLAAEGVNGHTWVFYGALSSVEYTLTVTDTQTGAARRYVNPASRLGSVADTHAFGPLGATPSSLTLGPEAEAASAIVSASRSRDAAAAAPCVPSASRLCLNGGRFAVEARWRAQGKDGVGTAVPLTGDTGYFWFFGAANVEIVLKVLDGRPLNGKFWVFYGALSDVAYTLTVTDTQTGETKTYENPQGRLASVADTGAF